MSILALFSAVALSFGPALGQPADLNPLDAAVTCLSVDMIKAGVKQTLRVDPRQLLINDQGRIGAEGQIYTSATNTLGSVDKRGSIEVMSLERARACDDYVANNCLESNAFRAVAFSAPKVTGQTATVEALMTTIEGPVVGAAAGSRASKGSKGAVALHFELRQSEGVWVVSQMKTVGQT